MKKTNNLAERIVKIEDVPFAIRRLRLKSKTIAFIDGMFDVINEEHIQALSEAAAQADVLIVGIHSDESVKKIKESGSPVNSEQSRAAVLSALIMVDVVVIFDDENSDQLISLIQPEVTIAGSDSL